MDPIKKLDTILQPNLLMLFCIAISGIHVQSFARPSDGLILALILGVGISIMTFFMASRTLEPIGGERWYAFVGLLIFAGLSVFWQFSYQVAQPELTTFEAFTLAAWAPLAEVLLGIIHAKSVSASNKAKQGADDGYHSNGQNGSYTPDFSQRDGSYGLAVSGRIVKDKPDDIVEDKPDDNKPVVEDVTDDIVEDVTDDSEPVVKDKPDDNVKDVTNDSEPVVKDKPDDNVNVVTPKKMKTKDRRQYVADNLDEHNDTLALRCGVSSRTIARDKEALTK